jgi:hypothetical protein
MKNLHRYWTQLTIGLIDTAHAALPHDAFELEARQKIFRRLIRIRKEEHFGAAHPLFPKADFRYRKRFSTFLELALLLNHRSHRGFRHKAVDHKTRR